MPEPFSPKPLHQFHLIPGRLAPNHAGAADLGVGLARSPKPFGKAESKPPLSGTKTPLDKDQTKQKKM